MGTTSDLSRRDFLTKTAIAAGAAGIAAMGMTGVAKADEAPEATDPAEESSESGFTIEGFCDWALEGGNAGASGGAYFLPGEENRPTDEELVKMLQTANTYFQCHGLTGTHFVVVKDADEQAEIFRMMGADGTGTVAILIMADGCNDQEHHAEEYYPGMQEGKPQYWQMPYALVEAGWATGYLNLAARSMGYRTRVFGALNIPSAATGEVDTWIASNWDSIQIGMWDIEKYMQPKDGGDEFEHYCVALEDKIVCDHNVTLVAAMLIGHIDEVDAETGATANSDYKPLMRENYDFWD